MMTTISSVKRVVQGEIQVPLKKVVENIRKSQNKTHSSSLFPVGDSGEKSLQFVIRLKPLGMSHDDMAFFLDIAEDSVKTVHGEREKSPTQIQVQVPLMEVKLNTFVSDVDGFRKRCIKPEIFKTVHPQCFHLPFLKSVTILSDFEFIKCSTLESFLVKQQNSSNEQSFNLVIEIEIKHHL